MKKTVFAIFGLLVIATIFAYAFERTARFRELKNVFQSKSIPDGMLNYGTMGKVLKESSLVKAIPNHSSRIPVTGKKFQKGVSRKTIVRIHLKTDIHTRFQIFWADEGQPYTEKRSAKVKIRPEKSRYECILPNLSTIRKLRIDPTNKPARMYIDYIIIENSGYEPILFHDEKTLKQLIPVSAIQNIFYDTNGLNFSTDNQDPQFEVRIQPVLDIESMVFQRKRQIGEYLYVAKSPGSSAFQSSSIIKPEHFKKNWPLLSIVVKNDDLYHPDRGIAANKTSRGRQWERPAYVSYFEDGKELFATMAGLRIHGGKRLQLFSSFRLYFRNEYGASEFKPGILFSPRTEPLKRLVVHHTAWPPGRWYFNNTLAYDIARQIGCVAPETKLCTLFINGVSQGIYFLTPQLHRRQLKSFFGHDNFKIHSFKTKSSDTSKIFYVKHFWRITHSREKLRMADVKKSIDLDNLTRHLFSFVFCGTTDFCQGAAVLDKSRPDSKLFWMNWDMDHSFFDVHKTYFGKKLDREIWEQSAWRMIYKKKMGHCGRIKLFSRLIDEDPEYRRFVVSLTMGLLNHRLNTKFFQSRLHYYGHMLKSYGENNPDSLLKRYAEFLEKRPEFVRDEMQEIFNLGQSVSCRVNGPTDIEYKIDAYPESANYQGWYFQGTSIKVEITSSHIKSFSHWFVNGKKISRHPLIYKIDQETAIEPVFKG